MERIDLFDRYFNGALSIEEKKEFQTRLEIDEEFASDFKIYSMTVSGICKEAEQSNADFGVAMKHLSKEQLFEIIGRQTRAIKPEDVVKRLQSRIVDGGSNFSELSGAAALDEIEDDEYSEDKIPAEHNDSKADSGSSSRRFMLLFFAIIVLLIILSFFL